MRFKPGQEVTPTKKASEWVTTIECMPIPDFDSYPLPNYPEFMTLAEIPGFYYWEENFEPLVPTEKVERDLEEVISSVEDVDEVLIKRIEEVLKSFNYEKK
jgi:hypothetical protein